MFCILTCCATFQQSLLKQFLQSRLLIPTTIGIIHFEQVNKWFDNPGPLESVIYLNNSSMLDQPPLVVSFNVLLCHCKWIFILWIWFCGVVLLGL